MCRSSQSVSVINTFGRSPSVNMQECGLPLTLHKKIHEKNYNFDILHSTGIWKTC